MASATTAEGGPLVDTRDGARGRAGVMTTLARRDETDTDSTDLVERAATGDAGAYAQLYRTHHRYIARIVADGLADADARNDVCQAVFEQAWVKLDTLRDPAAFRPWIAQIARRMVIDHHRRSSRLVATDFTSADDAVEPVADDWSAHDWAAMRELAEAVDVAIEGLSPRDITVLELASMFGFGAAEIAAALDVTPGHARVLLHRARQRLSAGLAEQMLADRD